MDKAADAADKLNQTVTRFGHETGDEFSARTQAWADGLANTATAAASADNAITLLSNDQIRALREVNTEFLQGAISGEEYARRVAVAFGAVDEEIQKQLDELKQFNDQLNDLKSQLASANGDDVEVENLRHEQKIADLKAETDLSIGQRQKLEQLEEELHEANLKRIKAEGDARAQANAQGGGSGGASGGTAGGGSGGSEGGSGTPPPAPPPTAPNQPRQPFVGATVNVNVLPGSVILDQKVADSLARQFKTIIDGINDNSR
jgi:hypothetical protein